MVLTHESKDFLTRVPDLRSAPTSAALNKGYVYFSQYRYQPYDGWGSGEYWQYQDITDNLAFTNDHYLFYSGYTSDVLVNIGSKVLNIATNSHGTPAVRVGIVGSETGANNYFRYINSQRMNNWWTDSLATESCDGAVAL